MTDTLLPPFQTLSHFMSSHPGENQHISVFSGHNSSYIIGSESDPDNSSVQEYPHQTALSSDMGLRYMVPASEDSNRYIPESTTSRSPVYHTAADASISAPTSTSPFPPFGIPFQTGLTSSAFSTSHSPFTYPSSQSGYCMPDIKPSLSSLSQHSMAPQTRSPHLPQLGNQINVRDMYSGAIPQLRRPSDHISRSPTITETVRGAPLSPSSSSGFTSPSNMDTSSNGNSSVTPPLLTTEVLHQIQTSDGQIIRPDILGKIDKGFFMAEENWTCYRRNYFSLTCSYTISPYLPLATLHLIQGGSSLQIFSFSVSISAVVDGRDGKPIELVQHTPKRDKGPQDTPGRITLAPRPVSMFSSSADMSLGSRSLYDGGYSQNPGQPPTEYTFERIQFKQATANNGKRRAAQQYYHLLVELWADVGQQLGDGRWVKVAQRVSAPMVVRGRSPGHYQNERRGSNASTGGNGSSGPGNTSNGYTSNNGFPRSGDVGSSSMLSSAGYGASYDHHTRNYISTASSHISNPISPMISQEEEKYIAESPSHYGWHGSISSFERTHSHAATNPHPHHNTYPGASQNGYRDSYAYQLPSMPGMNVNGSFPTSPRIKPEFVGMSHNGWALPPPCGKYDAVNSKSFFAPNYAGEHSVNGA